jgi:hypothetical protein
MIKFSSLLPFSMPRAFHLCITIGSEFLPNATHSMSMETKASLFLAKRQLDLISESWMEKSGPLLVRVDFFCGIY